MEELLQPSGAVGRGRRRMVGWWLGPAVVVLLSLLLNPETGSSMQQLQTLTTNLSQMSRYYPMYRYCTLNIISKLFTNLKLIRHMSFYQVML